MRASIPAPQRLSRAMPMWSSLLVAADVDLDRMRQLARAAALVGADVVRSSRAPSAGEPKGLPGDWVTEVDPGERARDQGVPGRRDAGDPVPGRGARRWQRRGPALGGRSAGRHDELRPRLLGGRGVGGAGGRTTVRSPGRSRRRSWATCWHAAAGRGACWERPAAAAGPARVSARPPEQAVVATGFPFRRKERLPRYLTAMQRALERSRISGARGPRASTSPGRPAGCSTASSSSGLAPWDVAAGGLLVREAGGVVTDWAVARGRYLLVRRHPGSAGPPPCTRSCSRSLPGTPSRPADARQAKYIVPFADRTSRAERRDGDAGGFDALMVF